MKVDSKTSVFWDIPADKLDTLPQSFRIRRVLTHGGFFDIIQMNRELGKSLVAAELVRMKPTSMSARRYNYLKDILFA